MQQIHRYFKLWSVTLENHVIKIFSKTTTLLSLVNTVGLSKPMSTSIEQNVPELDYVSEYGLEKYKYGDNTIHNTL